MPAKKGGRKKKQNTEEEIKPMPSLVFNNIRMTRDLPDENEKEKTETKTVQKESESKQNIREKFMTEQLSKHNRMTYWLYAGMAIILVAIVFFWGYSLWANFTSINWNKTQEKKMVEKTSTDLNQAFQTDKQNDLQNQLTKLQIKEMIQQAMKNQSTTLVASTSTTSTTTTITNTSTIPTTTKN